MISRKVILLSVLGALLVFAGAAALIGRVGRLERETSNVPVRGAAGAGSMDASVSIPLPSSQPAAYETPSEDIRSLLKRLEPRAAMGDSAAMYDIYRKISECQRVIAVGLDEDELRVYAKVGAAGNYIKDTERALADCEGYNDLPQQPTAARWLERAAAAGSVDAQLLYAANPVEILGSPADMIREPEKTIEYKKKAMKYLDSAARAGDARAIGSIARAFENGILAPKNLDTAYSYYYALELLNPSLAPDEKMEGYARELGAVRVAAAKERGRYIRAWCCAGTVR